MTCGISVAALTGGKNVPSARFRVRQLIHPLAQNNVYMREFIAPINNYPPEKKWMRPMWLVASISARLPSISASHRYDITFLQRELISTFQTLETLAGTPRVFDVDDAIFLRRGGGFARRIARQSDLIVCGNEYLADYFSVWNQNVTVIPTAIDTQRYIPKKEYLGDPKKLVIGWIGTSTNIKYLKQIEPVLESVIKRHKDIIFRVISDKRPDFHGALGKSLDFVPWSSDIEVESIQGISIGIMPLLDTDWEKGKCSFKMLQYMACGIPVIASPVGMNTQVLAMGEVGVGAASHGEWQNAFEVLISDEELRKTMGRTGRTIIEKHFNTNVVARKLAQHLKQLV